MIIVIAQKSCMGGRELVVNVFEKELFPLKSKT